MLFGAFQILATYYQNEAELKAWLDYTVVVHVLECELS